MFALSLGLRILGVVLVVHGTLLAFSIRGIPELIPGGWLSSILVGLALFAAGAALFLAKRKRTGA
jgi:hypothetical protein